jgi:putative glutamine amidotransferase
MPRPLIGLTTTLHLPPGASNPMVGIRRTYIQAILDAGGLPVLVPPAPEDVLRAIFARLDGLLLPGGGDVAPTYYGEEPHSKLGSVEPERDDLELSMCRWALDEEKPVLAICRGIQVMNVAAGGSLYQDIPAQYATEITHASDPALPRGYLAHTVALEPGSRLALLAGSAALSVNSWHHQALKRLGRGLAVSARAPDGIVEGVERPGHRFAVGVQFHPEDLYAADERVHRLFAGFVTACA